MFSKNIRIGIIGFGEAGFALANGLRNEGITEIVAYDKYSDNNPLMIEKAENSSILLFSDIKQTVEHAQFLFIAVPGIFTEEAVLAVSRYCSSETVIIDLTTTSPKTKKNIISQIPNLSKNYIDCGVLGAFSTLGHKVPILASGEKSFLFSKIFNQFGMNIRAIGESVGQASTVKILRSIFIKGVEALLVEMLYASDKYGIEDQVLESLKNVISYPFINFVNNLVTRHAIHAERRVHETNEIIDTLIEIGIDPIMVKATRERLQWSSRLNLKEHFDGKIPKNYKEVLKAIRIKT